MERYEIVTEAKIDVLLLRALLGIHAEDSQITFVAAGGWSSADSYARTVLIQDKANVAVVVNADTTDHNGADSRKNFLRRSLAEVAMRRKFRVIVVEPSIEALLFQDRSVLEQLIGRPIVEEDFAAAADEPRKALARLLRPHTLEEALQAELPRLDLSRLANSAAVRDLKSFLPHARQPASAVR